VQKERRPCKKDTEVHISDDKEIATMPLSISDYNANMGGVDTFDQLSSYYTPQMKSRQWYIKVFYHLLEIAIIYSYIIYKQTSASLKLKILSHSEYRKEIIRALVYDLRVEKKSSFYREQTYTN
jgi:hypothetical protein